MAGRMMFARGMKPWPLRYDRREIQRSGVEFPEGMSADTSDGDRDHAQRSSMRFHGNAGFRLSDAISTRFYASVNHIRQELPGALTYVVETAPRHSPFVCGVVFSCVTFGVATATGVSLAVRSWLPAALVPTIGWRLAFVLGGLGGLLSFVLRRSLEESPEFSRMRSLASRQPFRELLQTHGTQVLVGCAVLAGTACFNGLFFSHLPAHLAARGSARRPVVAPFEDLPS